MPVTGLPIAVEAVLESLMSQYHLVSWQVSGGDRGVVLTLRWSTTEGELHQSPQRSQGGSGGKGGGGGSGGHTRHRKRTSQTGSRSRRTQQWVDDQDTTDSRAIEDGDVDDRESGHRRVHHRSIPRHKHHHPTQKYLGQPNHDPLINDCYNEDEDDDPPPLPPPPPILDEGYPPPDAYYSDDSQATTDTVVDADTKKPHFKQMVHKHKKGILKMGSSPTLKRAYINENTNSLERGRSRRSNHIYPVSDLDTLKSHDSELKPEKDERNGKNTTNKDQARRRYHFRELIRKHSEEIKKLAAERRRKERDRERLRELEKAKAKNNLSRAKSEDNIVTLSSREDDSPSEENPRAVSEANISSKNADGARRVRFSETGAVGKNNNNDEEKPQITSPTQENQNETGFVCYAGDEVGDEVEEEDFVDPDEEVDSSDAEEVVSHAPRRIGAIFQIGLMVAKRKRRAKLK